jgi:hypothetical protein
MTWIERIGMGNGSGDLSFNKTVTATTLALFWYMVVKRYDPAWSTLSFGIVVIGAGFGLKGYLGAVKQNRMDGTSQVTTSTDIKLTGDMADVVRAVKERRSASDVEPTP